MKVSLNWLRELVDGDLDGRGVAERLTMAGLEVESRVGFGVFSGVIVAEVKSTRPHPNASKLTLVEIDAGGELAEVVCGASNVPGPSGLVLWARPGARLPKEGGDLYEITPKAVRGIVSPGMLCAEDELGLGSSHDGILVLDGKDGFQAGDDLARKLGWPDEILEVNVTPNRPDCLGHLGIAREIAALTGLRLRNPERQLPMVGTSPAAPISVKFRNDAGCHRYLALVLEDVAVRPSPLLVRCRLAALGMRSISGIVDATNVAMLEIGQPLHAFDLDRVGGCGIVVRGAETGESLQTLDGELRKLEPGDIVICDATSRPIALAGIMGGADTEVTPSTKRLLLECASFESTRIRRTAKRLGLHSEASHRFERGTDPNALVTSGARCAELLSQLGDARLAGPITDLYPARIEARRLKLDPRRTAQLVGCQISKQEQARLLSGIGLVVHESEGDLVVTVPTFRPDLTREIDLIEEIARLSGYERVPATLPRLSVVHPSTRDVRADAARDVLSALGLIEHIGYSFVSPKGLALFSHGTAIPPLSLQNPLREEQSAMRTTLLYGLLSAVGRNLTRGEHRVRLFEVGRVFWPQEGARLPTERLTVAGALSGPRDGWLKESELVDFFDLKGLIEELFSALGREWSAAPSKIPFLHPGLQAEARSGDTKIGWLGEVHPETRRRLGLEASLLAFELDLEALESPAPVKAAELPRFPAITRDLSFFIDEKIAAATIRQEMEVLRDPLCREIDVLEDYREPGRVPPGKKSMLWSFVYRAADRTLTVEEVKTLHQSFVELLRASLPIELR
jgi:phenylalanyl-tRNA synthetase beta chain